MGTHRHGDFGLALPEQKRGHISEEDCYFEKGTKQREHKNASCAKEQIGVHCGTKMSIIANISVCKDTCHVVDAPNGYCREMCCVVVQNTH